MTDRNLDTQVATFSALAASRLVQLAFIGVIAYLLYQLLAFMFFPHGLNMQRLWDKETKLWPLEERIAGVADEYLRRSPNFRAAFEEFRLCAPECPAHVYANRNIVISQDWPNIFERLVVEKDWGALLTTEYSHGLFREIIAKHGHGGALINCAPKIGFYSTRWNRAYARFDGFDCATTSSSGAGG